jgi:F-type H+-transporting ATPase subunit b
MSFSPLAFAFQLVNFLVLAWLLKRWFYAPLLAAVDARRAELAGERAAAQAARVAADAAKAEADARIQALDAERAAVLDTARAQAAADRAHIAEAARKEAQERLDNAGARLAEELAAAKRSLRAEAVELGIALAGRFVAGLPGPAVDRGLREALAAWRAALPPEQAAALLDGAGRSRIATPEPLDAEAQAAWRALFAERFGAAVAPEFTHSPAIGAGVEIDFPGGSVRFSLRSTAEDVLAHADG